MVMMGGRGEEDFGEGEEGGEVAVEASEEETVSLCINSKFAHVC